VKLRFELRVLLVILTSTFLIFSFSHFGAKAFEGLVANVKGFSENTFIGPINVSGLEEAEAMQEVTTKVMEWQTNTMITLTFQGGNAPFLVDQFSFQMNESVQGAKDSTVNQILVSLDSEAVETVLHSISPRLSGEKVDIKRLEMDLLAKAAMLETGTINVSVEDFLITPLSKEQVIHTISIPMETAELSNIGATLMIEPKSTFSLLSFLEKQGLSELDSNSMQLLSSGIYQAILPTNFKIVERHIGTELIRDTLLGYEAKVDTLLKWDLSFFNPNEDAYKLEVYGDDQSLIIDLVGAPFLYQYSMSEDGLQEFEQKKIKQYSPLLKSGEIIVSRNGQKGYYIEIYRVIKDETDTVIEKQLVSKDYYPPIHQVEVYALKSAENVIPEQSEETAGLTGGVSNTPVQGATHTEGPNTLDESVDDEISPIDDSLWGKENETEK
jgi:hypothetical protein